MAANNNNICLRCNTPNQAGARFCRGCGHPLAIAAPPQVVPPGPPPQPLPPGPPQHPAVPGGVPPQPVPPAQPAQSPPARPAASRRAKSGFNYVWLSIGVSLVLLCGLLGVIGWYFSPYWPGLPAEAPLPSGVAVASPVPATSLPPVSTPSLAPARVITPTLPLESPTAVAFVPTSTPALTSTPMPAPPTPSPLPPTTAPAATALPPAPTVPPASSAPILFRDDFETNIKPEWSIQADNKSLVNGQLFLEGTSRMGLSLGNTAWTDYTVSFTLGEKTNAADLSLLVRVQDEQNYLKIECIKRADGSRQLDCHWLRMAAGQLIPAPGTDFTLPEVGQVTVEIKKNIYRVIKPELIFTDLDQTVKFGGVALEARAAPLALDYFEVAGPLP